MFNRYNPPLPPPRLADFNWEPSHLDVKEYAAKNKTTLDVAYRACRKQRLFYAITYVADLPFDMMQILRQIVLLLP